MNGNHHNGKNHNFEKTTPQCLGRMVNLFESNVGVSANRLLTDKPCRDGLPLSWSRQDVTKLSPRGDQIEDKVIVSEYGNTLSSRKLNGTPMKRHIAQEMSKEVGSRHSPPNLVAKLMGLDALPQQESDFVKQRTHSRGHPQSQSDTLMSYWEQQNGCLNNVDPPSECKDVYETWQQSQKSSLNGKYNSTTNDKKMAFVRQKFVEAKRLSMDEKLRQSRQFQEALEVLNSNKDLFLKCLQEPNTMFSQQLFNMHSIFPPPETKRITVLRPAKMDSNNYAGCVIKDGKQMNRGTFVQLNGLEKSHLGSSPPACWKNYESSTQLTRIVVLKPSPGKLHDVEAMGFPQSDSPRILHDENFFGDVEDDVNQESREVAKAITHQIREKLDRHCRDETLVSSGFSNGYVGDESSFNKSEIEYAGGNLSDSEILSPVSRHSWDYVNRLSSPYSSSSFSRVSYSPESSVCKEAKKRLSERWSMMASNGICQEQRQVQKSSSTLGEMLALSEAKKEATPVVEENSNIEPKVSKILLAGGQKTDENVDNSPRNLVRSKSVPVSSSDFGVRLNVGISVPDKGKPEGPKDDTKERSAKSSFKGKVSSLFFSSNKKTSKDNPLSSQTKDEFHSRNIPGHISSERIEVLSDKRLERSSPCVQEPPSKSSFSNLLGEQGMISSEIGLSGAKAFAFGNPVENQDHPSPISVLDPPFEEDENAAAVFPHHVKPDQQGVELLDNRNGSNLIDKSPPIGSIARTLSWDDSCVVTASSYLQKESSTIQGTYDEEQEWFFFVKTLLSVAGLQGEVQSNTFLTRWHSSESPLDPSLRDKYIELKDKDTLHEAKRRQKRSTRKLVFDCVNTVLVDISRYGSGSDLGQRAIPSTVARNSLLDNTSITMMDEVWARINAYFSSEIKCISDDFGDDNSLVVDRVVRKEVVGKGWVDHVGLEMDNLGKEIESKLLEELMQEAVIELTCRVS